MLTFLLCDPRLMRRRMVWIIVDWSVCYMGDNIHLLYCIHTPPSTIERTQRGCIRAAAAVAAAVEVENTQGIMQHAAVLVYAKCTAVSHTANNVEIDNGV